jgi:3-oxoacyl-[acyl-carrier-protein] synthase-3
MRRVKMVATGSYLPGDPITNEEVERYAGELPAEVLDALQVKTRHWLADPRTGDQSETNSEMATKAARQALEHAGIDPAEIDLLVMSTASPDYHLPPTVTFVQDALGLRSCATVEIRSGCAGAVEGLDVARMYLERGQYHTAVVIGSEAISPLIVPVFAGKDPNKVRMRERTGIYSFGDGAGAMVLVASDGDGDGGVLGSAIACVGGGHKPGMQVVGGGTHAPFKDQFASKRPIEMKVDVVASGEFTPHVIVEGMRETVAAAGLKADQIDVCIIPEGNAEYMTDELREAGLLTEEWTALQPKILENLADVGATGSAAVPLCVDYGWKTGKLKPGQTIMLLAVETSKWKYGGWVFNWSAAPPS